MGRHDILLSDPAPAELGPVSTFVLLLASGRKVFPRLHYALPTFATFCRAEPVCGADLLQLEVELEELLSGLSALGPDHLLRLRATTDPEAPDLYQRAHYRGRTFDRRCVEPVPVAERAAFLEAAGAPQAASLGALYGPLIESIRAAARRARETGRCLRQAPRPYHRPPPPYGAA